MRIESDGWTIVLCEEDEPLVKYQGTVQEIKKLRAQGVAFAQITDAELDGIKINKYPEIAHFVRNGVEIVILCQSMN